MRPQRPRILVTNWAYPETLERLAAIGTVDANPDRTVWPRDEIVWRAAEADAIYARCAASPSP